MRFPVRRPGMFLCCGCVMKMIYGDTSNLTTWPHKNMVGATPTVLCHHIAPKYLNYSQISLDVLMKYALTVSNIKWNERRGKKRGKHKKKIIHAVNGSSIWNAFINIVYSREICFFFFKYFFDGVCVHVAHTYPYDLFFCIQPVEWYFYISFIITPFLINFNRKYYLCLGPFTHAQDVQRTGLITYEVRNN